MKKKQSDNENYSTDTAKTQSDNAYLVKKELLDSIINDTSSDALPGADKLYNEYRSAYEKQASLASKNAYGLAAANTGGYSSSYALSAAGAAYDKYMSQLSEDLPELAESASTLKKNERQALLDAYSLAADNDDTLYSRYRDTVSDEQKNRTANEDELENSRAFALKAAEKGDYSLLNALGVDTSYLEYSDLLDDAVTLAGQSDYSALETLGVDVTGLREKDKLNLALSLAKYGDYSLLGDFSSNISAAKEKINFTVQKGAEAAYENGGKAALVSFLDRQVNYGQITENGKKQILKALAG